jgi:transposase
LEAKSDDQVVLAGAGQRVARCVEAGHSCHAAARSFEISVAFVVRLMAASCATGHLAPKPEDGWRDDKLDARWEFLIRRVTEKGDVTMAQLAGELAALGTRTPHGDPALVHPPV